MIAVCWACIIVDQSGLPPPNSLIENGIRNNYKTGIGKLPCGQNRFSFYSKSPYPADRSDSCCLRILPRKS